MADRKPIVYVAGYPQELASSDRLSGLGKTTVAATAPTSPETGDFWLNSTTNELSIWDGSRWTKTTRSFVAASAPSNPATGDTWLNSK